MRFKLLVILIFACLLNSCCKDVEPYAISGRVLNHNDSTICKNKSISISFYFCRGSYGSSYETDKVTTDSNGNFSYTLDMIQPDEDYTIDKDDTSSAEYFSSNKRGAIGDIYL